MIQHKEMATPKKTSGKMNLKMYQAEMYQTIEIQKENTTYQKFTYHPKLDHKFQNTFGQYHITLEFNNTNNIKTSSWIILKTNCPTKNT